jgi:undecaprenyl diphosphate synthase
MALDTSQGHQKATDTANVPQHVAIIMDGNGRWAERQGMPRLAGHRAGTERLRQVLSSLGREGVQYVTVFAFSTENWGRPSEEVQGLMAMLETVIKDEIPKLHEQNIRILHMGSLERLPLSLRRAIDHARRVTADNTGLTLSVGFDYGGRKEIVEAVRRIVDDAIPSAQVDEETIRSYLSLPAVPDPDFIIRTAGEQRLSNFLIWQSAYSEMYYTTTCWPDFDDSEIEKALDAYRHRQRRFGKLNNHSREA